MFYKRSVLILVLLGVVIAAFTAGCGGGGGGGGPVAVIAISNAKAASAQVASGGTVVISAIITTVNTIQSVTATITPPGQQAGAPLTMTLVGNTYQVTTPVEIPVGTYNVVINASDTSSHAATPVSFSFTVTLSLTNVGVVYPAIGPGDNETIDATVSPIASVKSVIANITNIGSVTMTEVGNTGVYQGVTAAINNSGASTVTYNYTVTATDVNNVAVTSAQLSFDVEPGENPPPP